MSDRSSNRGPTPVSPFAAFLGIGSLPGKKPKGEAPAKQAKPAAPKAAPRKAAAPAKTGSSPSKAPTNPFAHLRQSGAAIQRAIRPAAGKATAPTFADRLASLNKKLGRDR